MKRIIALCFCFLSGFCMAQTAPSTGVSFGVTTSAANVHIGGKNIPAADATESLAIVNSAKLGMFYVQADQITSTDQTFNGYLAGLKWTPKIDGLISKTLLPSNTFQVSLQAEPGIIRNAAGRNTLGGTACGSLDYAPNSDGHFAVSIVSGCYLSASGFGASPNGYQIKSGIAVYFGGTK